MEPSSISIDLTGRSFTISGSEDFVSSHLEQVLSLIAAAPRPSEASQVTEANMGAFQKSQEGTDLRSQCESSGIFYLDSDTKLPVLQARIPGENMREQMRNVALLLLYGANRPIEAAYIKEQCRKQSCLDTGNFAKAYEMDKRNFIKKGKAGSRDWTLELTIPGKKTAESLIQLLLDSIEQ